MKKRRLAAAAAAAALTVAAAIATELALPSVAEDRLRGELSRLGTVTDVEVSATPAVKLLFGGVDRVSATMMSATFDTTLLDPDMLAKARGVDEVRMRIGRLRAGPVDVDDVVLNKHGDALDASANLNVVEIEKLVPGAKLTAEGGKTFLEISKLPVSLPIPGPIRFEISAEDGNVVARPVGMLSALMPAQRLMSRPEISVDSLKSDISAAGVVKVAATATINEA